MRITMVAFGSTGDVRPHVILGKELKRRGHTVRIAAFSPFEKMVVEAGLLFTSIPGDVYEYMARLMKPGLNLISFLPEFERSLDGSKDYIIRAIMEASEDAELLITTFLGSMVYSCAEKLNVPCIQTHYYPMDPNEDIPLVIFPQLNLGKTYIESTYKLSWLAISIVEKRMLTDWRKEQGMDIPPLRSEPVECINGHRVPVLYAVSPALLPKPADWDEHIYLTGFWQEPDKADYQPSKALTEFLAAGDPPVYIGFGSMVSGDMSRFFSKVLQAVSQTGLRVFLDGCWSSEALPAKIREMRNVYINTEFINHTWLFPRMRAVVHHGGIGTTATGLQAGRPTLIIPFGGDQPFWGQQIYAMGLGPKPIRRTLLTVQRLADELRDLVCNSAYAQNATAVSQKLALENGVTDAADIIERESAAWRSEPAKA